ncbi:MAG: hypothetical protein J4G12_10225 [Gemmatimonadetes bacterium]|nr:hypothetical protein [Gemmatimonadota bacterium]
MRHTRILPRLALVICGAFTVAVCSDGPTEPEEHHDPHEVKIVQGGTTLATYSVDNNSWDDHLDVEVGTLSGVTVDFLAEDGDVIQDDEAYLDIVIDDVSITSWEPSTPGGFTGAVNALQEGETAWTIRLMHGEVGSGHPDLVTTPIDVHVEEHQN